MAATAYWTGIPLLALDLSLYQQRWTGYVEAARLLRRLPAKTD